MTKNAVHTAEPCSKNYSSFFPVPLLKIIYFNNAHHKKE